MMSCTRFGIAVVLTAAFLAGCARRTSYVKATVGPRGQVQSMERVHYSPEQIEQINKDFGYAPPRKVDPTLEAVEKLWSKLDETQRIEILSSMKKMVGE